jgi:hypothetical protein
VHLHPPSICPSLNPFHSTSPPPTPYYVASPERSRRSSARVPRAAFAFPDGRPQQPRAAPPLAAAQRGPAAGATLLDAARPGIHLERVAAPSLLALAPLARTPAAASPVPRPHTLRSPLPEPGVEATTRVLSLGPSSSRSTRSCRRHPMPIWTLRHTPSRLPLVSCSLARRYRHRRQSSRKPSRRRRGSDRTPHYPSASHCHHRSVVPHQRASPPHPIFTASQSSRARTSLRSSSSTPWMKAQGHSVPQCCLTSPPLPQP